MNNLEKIPVYYNSMDSLIQINKNEDVVKFDNLGIITNKRAIICQILYKEKELIKSPYGIKVNKNSLVKWRKIITEYMIDLSITNYQLGRTSSTINGKNSNIIAFFDWIDKNKLDLNDTKESAVHIYQAYTLFLKSKIRDGSIKNQTASMKQTDIRNMLHAVYSDQENQIGSNASLILGTNQRTSKTQKSSIADQKYHYQFYDNFFHQVSNFILENKQFPTKLNLANKEIWCLPSKYMFFNRDDKIFPNGFNYLDGTVKEVDVLAKERDCSLKHAKMMINNFSNTLDKANKHRSQKKLYLATHALKAFYMLFLANTGMNDSTAATLKWNSDYSIDKQRQKFRNIKYRAGNKTVEFEIGSGFVKEFKQFLELRSYVLGKQSFEYLFFVGSGDSVSLSPRQEQGSFSSIINKRFKNHIDSDLPTITSRILRVNKTYQSIKQHGIIAASQLAQTSISTLIEHYQGASDELVTEEFGKYFNRLNYNLFNKSYNQIETAIGRCSSMNQPKQLKVPQNFIGCDKKEGCLFCESYRLHAEKEDINKIFSLKYIINECKYIAKDDEHFKSVYSVVLNRIDNIFQELIQRNYVTKKELKEFEKDVFENENLHPYWEHKLKTLIAIGVLS